MSLQRFVEIGAVWLIMWGEDRRRLIQLVLKNLNAHSPRNTKTAVMFSTALAFVIFAGLGFQLLGHNIQLLIELASAADILVLASGTSQPLAEADLRTYLNAEKASATGLVVDYTFVSFELARVSWIDDVHISNLAGYPDFENTVYAVERNFLDVAYSEFWRPTEVSAVLEFEDAENGEPDVIRSLYDNAHGARAALASVEVPESIMASLTGWQVDQTSDYVNYIDLIISEALRDEGSLDTSTPILVDAGYYMNTRSGVRTFSARYLGIAQGMASRVPGFFFSSYRQTAYFAASLITEDAMLAIMNETYLTDPSRVANGPMPFTSTPKERLLVRVVENTTAIEREQIINSIRNYVSDDTNVFIVDTGVLLDSTDTALTILNVFFLVVSLLAIVLCFFVCWLSFTANVRENSWQFGVLRALGLTARQVVKMYIYEALAITISGSLLGTAVGILVALTLTLEFNLFLELPFYFDFPYTLYFIVLGVALVVAVVASALPAYNYQRKK